jgi:hypothetical protein
VSISFLGITKANYSSPYYHDLHLSPTKTLEESSITLIESVESLDPLQSIQLPFALGIRDPVDFEEGSTADESVLQVIRRDTRIANLLPSDYSIHGISNGYNVYR